MQEKNVSLSHSSAQGPRDLMAKPQLSPAPVLSGEQRRDKVNQAVVRLIVRLERAARAELPIAERTALLQDLQPKVEKITARLPKTVANARQFSGAGAVGQTSEQRLDCLMAKNLKLALDGFGGSELAYSETSGQVRSWLVTNLFRFLGRQIEYAVRWNRPYPPRAWAMLHESHFDLGTRGDLSPEPESASVDDSFNPGNEYKRLLLLGLVGQLVAPAGRSTQLLDSLTSSARESRLEHPASYSGSFGVFVVEVTQDAPPRISSTVGHGFNGWVFDPAPKFLDAIGEIPA